MFDLAPITISYAVQNAVPQVLTQRTIPTHASRFHTDNPSSEKASLSPFSSIYRNQLGSLPGNFHSSLCYPAWSHFIVTTTCLLNGKGSSLREKTLFNFQIFKGYTLLFLAKSEIFITYMFV